MSKKPTRTAARQPQRVKVASRIRTEVRELRRAGWTLTTGGRHPMLTCPAGHHAIAIPQDDGGAVLAFRRSVKHHAGEACP